MPQKLIFNKKAAPNFYIFLPRSLLGRLTAAIHGLGVPPPLRRVPSPRQIPGYAYGEVGRQIRRRTAIQRSVGQHSDFKENALRNTKPMETGERIRDVF